MADEKQLSEQESLKLITDMIKKVKHTYHDTGISPLLWGSTIFIASLCTFLRWEFGMKLPFDVWLLTLIAIVPQVYISFKEAKSKRFSSHSDVAMNAVWITYAIMLFGLVAYQNIVPGISNQLIKEEGWQLMKHSLAGEPDEIISPFVPSITSLFLLLYAMPTVLSGIIKQFRPMLVGGIATYLLFIASLFTASEYDMLFSAAAALVCWFIPGIILRKRYLDEKKANV